MRPILCRSEARRPLSTAPSYTLEQLLCLRYAELGKSNKGTHDRIRADLIVAWVGGRVFGAETLLTVR